MKHRVEIRVQYRNRERVLILKPHGGYWHAEIAVPGQKGLLSNDCYQPSPAGTVLPKLEVDDFLLRIEAPAGKVTSMEMGKVIVAGASVKDGYLLVSVQSLMRDFKDSDWMAKRDRRTVLALDPVLTAEVIRGPKLKELFREWREDAALRKEEEQLGRDEASPAKQKSNQKSKEPEQERER